jgi:hypothetical protein
MNRRRNSSALIVILRCLLPSVVLPAESDLAVAHGQESMIGDGDAVCVACQVVEYIFRSAERAFGVDHPLLTKERSQELGKGPLRGQWLEAAGEDELTLMEGDLQAGDELATKDAAEYSWSWESREHSASSEQEVVNDFLILQSEGSVGESDLRCEAR